MAEKPCAIVTGGARGIGRAIAMKLAREGYSIVINYNSSAEAAEELVGQIESEGGEAIAVKADVADFKAAGDLVAAAKEAFGGVWALVNNAGVTRDGLLLRMKEADFDDVMDTNLKGAFNMMRHAAPLMLRARAGRIVNISSIAGVMGNAGQANYSASKAGLIGLTKSAARELGARGITVNAIAPGIIESDMTRNMNREAYDALLSRVPLGRAGEPEEVAALAAFLISGAAAYITGQTLIIDGGLAM